MIRRINYPKHPHMLQVYHACLTCLKRFHSADILQLLFFISKRKNDNMLMFLPFNYFCFALPPHDSLIKWAGEDLGEIWGVDFSPSI